MGSEEVKIERRKRSGKTVNCQGVRLTKGRKGASLQIEIVDRGHNKFIPQGRPRNPL